MSFITFEMTTLKYSGGLILLAEAVMKWGNSIIYFNSNLESKI